MATIIMDTQNQTCSNKVQHGSMTCDRCWKNVAGNVQESGSSRLVRDPGHWGSANPSTLVLGISKGNTQSSAFANGNFDDVAFKGMRDRLLRVLQCGGLLAGETASQFENRFRRNELEYAFASVVRCSLTGLDRKKLIHTADSQNVIPAFKVGSPGHQFVASCVDQHLGTFPQATERIVLLGNADAYIKNLRALVRRLHSDLRGINDVAYEAGGILFVHVAHPSRGNGHFGAYVRGEGASGEKMRQAREALGFSDPSRTRT